MSDEPISPLSADRAAPPAPPVEPTVDGVPTHATEQGKPRPARQGPGASGTLPVGVALLLAAICGVLLVTIPATGRSLQHRRAVRRHARKVS